MTTHLKGEDDLTSPPEDMFYSLTSSAFLKPSHTARTTSPSYHPLVDISLSTTSSPPQPPAIHSPGTSLPSIASEDDGENDEAEGEGMPSRPMLSSGTTSSLLERPEDNERKRLVPSTVYTDTPKSVRININKPNDPLLNSLLSNAQIPGGVISLKAKAPYRDRMFGTLYLGCLAILFLSGILITGRTSSVSLDDVTRNAFYAIKKSLGLLIINFTVAIVCGAIWVYLVKNHVKQLVSYSLVTTCGASFVAFAWSFSKALGASSQPEDLRAEIDFFWLTSFLSAVVGLVFFVWFMRNKEKLARTLHVLELTAEMLSENPSVFRVSFFLLACQILFIVVWLFMFAHLFLNGSYSGNAWTFDRSTFYVVFFYIFMFFWTCSIFNNIQRATLAGITSFWYFHRHDASELFNKDNIADVVLKRCATSSFGSICYGSLLYAAVRVTRFATDVYKKRISNGAFGHRVLSTVLLYAERAIEFINQFAFSCVGITGESFCASARMATKLFRRNLVFSLLTDILINNLFLAFIFVVSLLSALVTYTYAIYTVKSQYAYVAGLTAFWVSWYIVEFCTNIVNNIADAIFVCYSIDLDTNTCHHSKTHNALRSQSSRNDLVVWI